MPAPKYLLIDFDNTMMGTEQYGLPSLIARFNALYGRALHAPLTYDAYLEHFHGLSREGLCAALAEHFGIAVDYAELYRARDWRMMQHMKTIPGGIPMAPHLLDTLHALKQKNILPCFVSNNTVQRAMAALHLADNRRGAELAALIATRFFEAGDTQKPKPDIYLRAVEFLDAAPAHCIAVEDSVTGVLSATGAGLVTYGYTGFTAGPGGAAEKLRAHGASAIFHDWAEFPALPAHWL